MYHFIEAEQPWNKTVVIQSKLCGAITAGRKINAHILYNDQSDTACRAEAVVFNVLVADFSAAQGKIAPHGRHDYSVFEAHALDLEWRKQERFLF